MDRPTWWVSVRATVVLPVVVAVVSVAVTFGAEQGQPDARPLDVQGIALLLAGAATLVARHAYPSAVVAVAAIIAAGYFAADYPGGPAFLAAVVALCSAIVSGHRRGAYVVTALTFVVLVALHTIRSPEATVPLTGAISWLSSLAAIVAGAELWRARTERLAQATAARAEAELRQVTEERLRIARELHDALGHHVSLINVQAGVAHYLLDDDREQARRALAAIVDASHQLLVEMRSTLGVLRGADEQPSRRPAAGLAGLDDLVAASRAGGLEVSTEVRGDARELPAAVDLAAYRIVQEALTNTRKHAGAAHVSLVVSYLDADVVIEVGDDGRGGSPDASPSSGASGGTGLIGMRERASALGGRFTAGPGDDGGFRVRAHLPAGPGAQK